MAGKTSYKTLLLEARKLRGEAGGNAYRRARILVEVFDNRDFRNSVGAMDDFETAGFLDAEIEDLCLGFMELREMLWCFPDEKDWADGRLRTLYDKCVSMRSEAKEDKPARTVNRVTKKEFEAVEQERDHHKARSNFLEAENSRQVSILDQYKARIDELEKDNARLRGRIEELERQLTLVASQSGM